MPSLSRVPVVLAIVSQSDLEPMITPTNGCALLLLCHNFCGAAFRIESLRERPSRPIIYECGLGVYAEPRLKDGFAPTFRAPAGPGQAGAPAKDEPAVQATCRFHAEPALSRPGHRFDDVRDRKSTRLNSSHANISYAVFCLKKK